MRTRFNMEDDGNVGISYDNKQHIIKINYTTNDMVPTCNCGNRGVIDDNSEEEDDRSGNISCMYAFNGKTFVLKSKKVRRIKASD